MWITEYYYIFLRMRILLRIWVYQLRLIRFNPLLHVVCVNVYAYYYAHTLSESFIH